MAPPRHTSTSGNWAEQPAYYGAALLGAVIVPQLVFALALLGLYFVRHTRNRTATVAYAAAVAISLFLDAGYLLAGHLVPST